MSLLSLPDELLLIVAGFIVDEADHSKLARTNLRLHRLLTKSLYQRIISGPIDARKRLPTPTRRTPLHWAATKHRMETAQLALSYGVNINARDDQGRTALFIAADKGHLDLVKFLLAFDEVVVDIEADCGWNSWNPLLQACWKNRAEIVTALINSGKVEPNAKCSTGWTPL